MNINNVIASIVSLYKAGVRQFHVSGMIGAGKSTLIKATEKALTEEGYKVVLVPERINMEMFNKYLADPAKYALIMQQCFMVYRLDEQTRANFRAMDEPKTIFLHERSSSENRPFVNANMLSGYIAPADARDLEQQTAPQRNKEHAQHAFLFVETSITTCYRRMCKRNRSTEGDAYSSAAHDEPAAYFSELYEEWCKWRDEVRGLVGARAVDIPNEEHNDVLAA